MRKIFDLGQGLSMYSKHDCFYMQNPLWHRHSYSIHKQNFQKCFEFAFTHFYSHIIMKLFKITKKTLRNEMTKNRKLECTLEKTHRTGFGLRPHQLIVNKCNRKINNSKIQRLHIHIHSHSLSIFRFVKHSSFDFSSS